jgi:hypothetical protein
MFLRQIGGLIGVSIFGAMLTAKLQSSLQVFMPGMKIDLGKMEAMAMASPTVGQLIKTPAFVANAFGDAMNYVFGGSMVVIAIAFTSIFFIPHIQLRGRGPQQASENKVVQEAEAALADAAPSPADPAPMPERDR